MPAAAFENAQGEEDDSDTDGRILVTGACGFVYWGAALSRVNCVVQAGTVHAAPGARSAEQHYHKMNGVATGKLARAAARAGVKRFVFLSLVRAQSGAAADRMLTQGKCHLHRRIRPI